MRHEGNVMKGNMVKRKEGKHMETTLKQKCFQNVVILPGPQLWFNYRINKGMHCTLSGKRIDSKQFSAFQSIKQKQVTKLIEKHTIEKYTKQKKQKQKSNCTEIMWLSCEASLEAGQEVHFHLYYLSAVHIYAIYHNSSFHCLHMTGINWSHFWPASIEASVLRWYSIAPVLGSSWVWIPLKSQIFTKLSLQLLKLLHNFNFNTFYAN